MRDRVSRTQRFVAYGCSRAKAALEPDIRAKVALEFEERLKMPGPQHAHALLKEMEREIKHRVQRMAPADALY